MDIHKTQTCDVDRIGSTQIADSKYKDHRVGQLTRDIPATVSADDWKQWC